MLEKDTEFLGAIQFSDEHQMQTASLHAVRGMIHAQVFRTPPDFHFLCQGRAVKRVWEADRLAWSTVPFAVRGSPGLRMHAMSKNRKLERPAHVNRFEFRYMGNTLPRYKKRVDEINPVYAHQSFHISNGGGTNALEPSVQWRVATNWSGEWVYNQASIHANTKAGLQKRLRTAARPQHDMVVVKSHRGELISPCMIDDQTGGNESNNSNLLEEDTMRDQDALVPSEKLRRIPALTLSERKDEAARREQRVRWKARVIAMEAQQRKEELEIKESSVHCCRKEDDTRRPRTVSAGGSLNQVASTAAATAKTVLVHIEEDGVFPSRLVPTFPKKRRRPRKKRFSKYEWYIPSRQNPTPAIDKKKLLVRLLSEHVLLKPSPCSSNERPIGFGQFLTSSSICLEVDEVEVFPVLIIRPIEEQIVVNASERADASLPIADACSDSLSDTRNVFASRSYLSEFEYELSEHESNYEALFHHISSSAMQDALVLNRQDIVGRTMLHDAAEFGHGNVMELLLKTRVLLNVGDRNGDTALHHAARRGQLREASFLLREKAIAWKHNNDGKSPLFCALETAARELSQHHNRHSFMSEPSRQLDEPKATKGIQNESRGGSKHLCSTHPRYPRLRQVIDLLWDTYPSEELLVRDIYDRKCCLQMEKEVYGDMFRACRNGNLLRVQRLIDLEKRPIQQYINDQLDTLGRTALHEAAELGHTAVVDLLLKVGADGYLKDQRLQTPLHVGAAKGYQRIAKCLMFTFPGTLGFQDVSGKTPLHLAIERQHWTVAMELVAQLNDRAQRIPHFSATVASAGDEMASMINSQDIHGYTALHYACIHGNEDVCFALLQAGANPMISRITYSVPYGKRELQGVYWKRSCLFRNGDTGIDPSVSSIRRWTSNRNSSRSDLEVAFDTEAPLELLLMACKHKTSRFSACIRILETILSPRPSVQWEECGKRAYASRVKRCRSPLFHLAADVACVNMSVAVELCRQLNKLQLEINMIHHRTGETVLLQECRRVCEARRRLLSDGQEEETTTQLVLIRTLLELGANVNLANEVNGESPLGCAAWHGHLPLLDLLLETQPDTDVFARSCSFSPLHFSALGNHLACAKRLISANATVNVEMPPANDETPLFFAIRSRSEAMVRLLLHSGANVGTLCTIRRGATSFGINLDLAKRRRPLHPPTEKMPNLEPSQKRLDFAMPSVTVVSPLTFALEVSRALSPFGVLRFDSACGNHVRKQSEWTQLNRICVMLANKIGESTTTSGLITRNDIYLASALGYWDLVKVLLSHQVVLSNISTSPKMTALHFAAAAGQTSVVTALVAAGMNVNCVVVGSTRRSEHRSASPLSKTLTDTMRSHRKKKIGTLCLKTGALFFALVNGHVETAAKLIVLGAQPLETLPHLTKVRRSRKHAEERDKGENESQDSDTTISFYVCESMRKEHKTAYVTGRYERRHMYADPSIHFIRHLERSINERIPLLHLEVWAGCARLSKVLVDAGMSIFHIYISAQVRPEVDDRHGSGETAIHVAVSRGHLDILKVFAKLAQNNFPKCFLGEVKKSKSLLVAACEGRQTEALAFLLRAGCDENDADGGGGFTYDEHRDEFQRALSVCASHQFLEGFQMLVKHGARPDIQTLVRVLQGIGEPAMLDTRSATPPDEKRARNKKQPPRASVVRGTHPVEPRNTVANARELLEAVMPFADDIDIFFSTSASFDILLKILIVCARCEFWFVLKRIFLSHAPRFLEPTSAWKPLVVRAVSCCLVFHRVALHNQVDLIQFILALGVPADLRLSEIPSAKSPIWYAASRGCLEAFVALAAALQSHSLASFVDSMDPGDGRCNLSISFRSIRESRSFLAPGSTCKWQNLSAFSCYDVPRAQTNGFLIQKLISYARWDQRHQPTKNSLLHIACDRGDLLTVQVLIAGGVDVAVVNDLKETPLVLAAARKDPYGVSIVRYLLSVLSDRHIESAPAMINRALVRCYAQPPPCNLKIANVLLAAGSDVNFSETEEKSDLSPSAMHCALRSAQFAAVKLLLDHGASLTIPLAEVFLLQFAMSDAHDRKLHWKRFASFLASKDQRVLQVESLMRVFLEKKHFPRAMNEDLLHQLIKCAAAFAATIARVLGLEKRFWSVVALALDAYPEESKARKAEWSGRTALHYAVFGLEVEVVEKLLDIGGYDVLAEDHARQTALHLVAMNGDARICQLLLQRLDQRSQIFGIDAADRRGRTALHVAVIHGHETVVELLLNAGASPAIRCEQGFNALLYACKCNRLGILMAVYARIGAVSRQLLYTPVGEYGMFVAARNGAFQIVRWLMRVYEEENDDSPDSQKDSRGLQSMQCLQQRTLLHYASMFGDDELIRLQLQQLAVEASKKHPDDLVSLINRKDGAGYTPLLYAFAFGRIQALQVLVESGSNADVTVDHSGEAKTHPYASSFSIGTLLQWFAFPGWLSFASKQFPPHDKCRITKQDSIYEDYLMNSSLRRWKVRKWTQRNEVNRGRASRAKKATTKTVSAGKYENVRTSMRSWRFPQLSFFDYICDIGDSGMVHFLLSMKLPLLLRRSTYQSQRGNILQAVRWNRLDIVKHLIAAGASANSHLTEATNHTDGLHFMDFLEVAIDCAVSRGHEEIATYLLTQWNGIKESGRKAADAGVFAFQFAHVLQIACIRRMTKLIEYMVNRGGEQLVAFHANDGPALVYAIAFGHSDIAALLAAHGASFTSMDAYLAPSVKKWVEFGCSKELQMPWLPNILASTTAASTASLKKPIFVGPIEQYETLSERLSVDTICHAFAIRHREASDATASAATDAGDVRAQS